MLSVIIPVLLFSTNINVGYVGFYPMAYEENGVVKGLDIDIFNEVCSENGWTPNYIKVNNADRFDRLNNGEYDILLGGVSITDERESKVEFSTPYMTSGIMIAAKKSDKSLLISIFESQTIWRSLKIMLITLLLFSHLIWFIERKYTDNIDDRYIPGIFDSLWYCWITITTIGYGDIAAKKYISRFTVFCLTLIGIGTAANIISEVAAVKVQHQVKTKFDNIQKLEGCKVGVVRGTTSEDLQKIVKSEFLPYPEYSQLEKALASDEVDAIAFDVPYIMSLIKKRSDIDSVGDVLYEQNYGFVMKFGSELRKAINIAILKMSENGTTNSLKVKWMGTS